MMKDFPFYFALEQISHNDDKEEREEVVERSEEND